MHRDAVDYVWQSAVARAVIASCSERHDSGRSNVGTYCNNVVLRIGIQGWMEVDRGFISANIQTVGDE